MTAKRYIPPGFTSDTARAAQRVGVASRRVTDRRLRQRLIRLLPSLPERLRAEVVAKLGQRTVDRLVFAMEPTP